MLVQLPHKPEFYIIPIAGRPLTEQLDQPFRTYDDFLTATSSEPLTYTRVSFSHPLIICYSSGTTGAPKCIVHQHGLILNLKKISMLHNSLSPKDTVLQYSSTSWVLFYIMNGHLSTGATTILYDGSPMWPDVKQFLRILERHKATYLGTSPRYIFELEKAGVSPKHEFDLSSLKMVNTTGATMSESQYRWFYANMPPKAQISNSAGGTDTATSLAAVDPAGPLHVGEMQIPALGIDLDVADPTTGQSIRQTGQPGEMVVRKPFPSMPPFFWGDKDNKIYKAAYFERFDNVDVWAQHDWLSYNPKTRGFMMHGRSDGVLNPSGIRFGSGEIYAVTEGPKFQSEIADTLCVGRRRPTDNDETVFLFVVMARGKAFTKDLEKRVRQAIAEALSPRHVPKFIVTIDEIPMTVNGKKVETAVKSLMSGRDIKVSSTVMNPDCLLSFRKFRDYEGPRESKL